MNVILFGATGMVGQAVLRECLRDDAVKEVKAVVRSPTGQQHPKLREITRKDLSVPGDVGELKGADACFFCLGVSSAGMSEPDYTRLTYDLTLAWAQALQRQSPDLVFTYVSGAGTAGKAMWAQVKKRTEDALLALFPNAYMFRLAALRPLHGEVSKTTWTRVSYALLWWLLPVVRALAPDSVVTSEELGRAMLRVARERPTEHIVESRDIRRLGS